MVNSSCISVPATQVPVSREVDVLVLGAGPAGCAAAVMAARTGAKTLLVDSASVPGGMTTAGMMSHYTGTVDSKLYEEVLRENARKNTFKTNERTVYIDPANQTLTWIELLEAAGAQMLMYTFAAEPILEGDTLRGVIVQNKSGRSAILAKVVIDATGDGDIAAQAGAEYILGRESDGSMQPATLMFKIGGVDMERAVLPGSFETQVDTKKGELQRLAKELLPHPAGHVLLYRSPLPGIVTVNMTNAIRVDGTRAEDLTQAEITCRKQIPAIVSFLREYAPGYENCYVIAAASLMGVRETRHFKGLYTLTEQDMFGSTLEDSGMFDIVDGQVVDAARSENFRAALEYMHYLCSEGLMNIEGITQEQDQYNANISNGKVGVFTGWAPYTYTSDAELQENYVSVGPLAAEGYTYRTMPTVLTANRCGFVITSECENVELALGWWDYLSRGVAATHAARSGPEGLTWEMVDGVPTSRVYTAEDAIAFGYEELAGHAGTSTFAASMGLTNCPPLIVDSLAPAPGTTGAIRGDAVKLYEPYFTEQSMSRGVVPSDAQEEFDFTCEGLEEAINAYAADAILNGVTDENWEAYLSKLDSLNYDYYIEFYQKKLDGNW